MTPMERAEAAGARVRRADLGRRLLVAVAGIPLAIIVVYAGGLAFALGLGVLAATAMWEYARMMANRGLRVPLSIGTVGAALLPLVVLYLGSRGAWSAVALLLLVGTGYGMLRCPPAEGPITTAAVTVLGVLYLGGLLSFGVPLRESLLSGRTEGTLLFFLPVALTWLADTAAYFGGRRFGRRRLAPRISPNKTIEGAAAAVVAGPVGAMLFGLWILPAIGDRLGPAGLVALGLVVSGAAILGDLVESALKRECAVKDSSNLLPGHGGLLDRLDSLLWSIPAAYLFLALVI